MAEILGLGVPHRSNIGGHSQGEEMGRALKRALADPALPERYRQPAGWPAPMREAWGEDQGLAAAERHREALLNGFRRVRQVLDDFAPDLVVIWSDDQYENFKEDIIPPFCVLAYESMVPPAQEHCGPNVWDKSSDTTFTYRGHVAAGKFLISGMLDAGFDLSSAYKPLHHQLGHAFLNTLRSLDCDRRASRIRSCRST